MNSGAHHIATIEQLLNSSKEAEATSIPQTIAHTQDALALARTTHEGNYIWQCIERLGLLMFRHKVPCLTEQDFLEGIECAQECGNEHKGILLYLQLATLYKEQSRYSEAIQYIQKAIQVAQQHHDIATEGLSYGHMGNIYYELGEYSLAFECLHKSLHIAEQEGNQRVIQSQLNNLGSLYHKLGRYSDALQYFEQSLTIRRDIAHPILIASSLTNIGDVYRALHQYEDALSFLNESLSISESIQNNHLIVLNKANIGLVHEETGNYNTSLQYCTEALELAKEVEPIQFVADLCCNLARVYNRSGEYNRALDLLDQSRVIALQHSNKDLLTIVYYNLSQVYENLGDIPQAYKWHKLFVETQHATHTEEKERDIARQERLLTLQKGEQARLLLEKQLMQSEQNALRAQINPHFLFNSLNSIQSLLADTQTEQALRYLSRFARLMRSILDNSRKASVSLQSELEIYQLYVDIEQLRFQHTFTYNVEIHPDCDVEDMDVPPMIAQPFLENAIWHGLLPKKENATLTVRIKPLDTNRYIMEVEDNGIGRERSQQHKTQSTPMHTSAGMNIINERLTILGNLLNLELHCTVEDVIENNVCSGTRVSIILPIQTIRV